MITIVNEPAATVKFPLAYKLRDDDEQIVLFCSRDRGVKLSGIGRCGEMECWISYDSVDSTTKKSVWIPVDIKISHT